VQFLSLIWGWILDVFDAISRFIANFVDDFKDSNRYFKIKVGLITGYVGVSLATVLVFIPPGELNEIDAEVRISKTEIVGGKYFMVANQSSDTWENIVLRLNDRYTISWPRLRPGKKKAFFFNRFKGQRAKAPREDIRVEKLRIECSEGAFERDFTKKR